MNKIKLKAYTILEITIAMIVSAIVISITYTVFGIVSNAYNQYRQDQQGVLELTQLDGLLMKDFAMAQHIVKEPDSLVFAGQDRRAVYAFSPTFIIRTSGITDTFKVSTQNIHFSFRGSPIGKADEPQSGNALIDGLSFDLVYKNRTIPYIYHKQYSSEDLLTDTANAIH